MKSLFAHRHACILLAALITMTLCGCAGGGAEEDSVGDMPPSAAETTPPAAETAPEQADAVETLLASMTVEEKVGQLFFVRCPEENAAEDVAAYHLGGVLLFGRDFKDKTYGEVRAATDALQAAAEIPLLIGADEEGGTVVRASSNPKLRSEKFAAPQTVYDGGGLEALRADALEKSSFLLGLGVNVNFAPVADVAADSGSFIYGRTLGLDTEGTAEGIGAIVSAMSEAKIGSVLKHFPGYGDNVDTHTGIALDDRPYEDFVNGDFLPFRAGIEAGSGSVLVSHNIVQCMDASLPASLSPEAHRILREELGFEGVILTDDLAMDALKAYAEDGTVAVLAVLAGNDMLVTTDYRTQIPQVLAAVEDGTISLETLDNAVARVLRWKQALGLLEETA